MVNESSLTLKLSKETTKNICLQDRQHAAQYAYKKVS